MSLCTNDSANENSGNNESLQSLIDQWSTIDHLLINESGNAPFDVYCLFLKPCNPRESNKLGVHKA